MQCPICGNEMEKGELRSRGGVYFLPEGEKTPLLYTLGQMEKHNAIYLHPYLTENPPQFPEAYACRTCKKLLISL